MRVRKRKRELRRRISESERDVSLGKEREKGREKERGCVRKREIERNIMIAFVLKNKRECLYKKEKERE